MTQSVIFKLKNLHGISYYKYDNKKATKTILFIHGLTSKKEYVTENFDNQNLLNYSWIIPDLVGHGHSFKSKTILSYKMEFQSDLLLRILIKEEIKELIVISHSMGGPIGLFLLDNILKLRSLKYENITIRPLLFINVEGNIDENDAFLSSQIASKSWIEFETKSYEEIMNGIKNIYPDYIEYTTAWDVYASSINLVQISKAQLTLPLLDSIKENIPVKILFGSKNKDRFSSEKVLREKNYDISYIPESGHNMLRDNPKGFWELVFELIILQ